jgi:hypothetical protein
MNRAGPAPPPRPDIPFAPQAWTAAPRQRRNIWPWVTLGVVLVIVLVAVVLVIRVGREHDTHRVQAPDATFQAPPGWTHTSGLEGIVHDPGFLENARWEENFVRDPVDVIFVAKLHEEGLSVSPAAFRAHLSEIKAGFVQGLEGAGATVVQGPTETELDGMPGLDAEMERTVPGGVLAHSRILVGYADSDEYLIRCQFDVAHEVEVRTDCDALVHSFHRI